MIPNASLDYNRHQNFMFERKTMILIPDVMA